MSGFVHYSGKITEIKPTKERSIEEIASKIVNERGFEVPYYYESNLQYLTEKICKEFILVNKKLYKIEKEDVMWEENLKAEICKDGIIKFDVKFHNGAMGLEDAIEKAIELNKIK